MFFCSVGTRSCASANRQGSRASIPACYGASSHLILLAARPLRRLWTRRSASLPTVARCPKTDALVFSFWREVENSTSQFAAIRSEVCSTNDGIALAVVTGSPFRDVASHIVDSIWATIHFPDTYFGPTWTRRQYSQQVSRIRDHISSPRISAPISSASGLLPF